MGKHRSDDSDQERSRRSKKKKRRRSRSSSDSESSQSRRSRRKHKKSSRSRSRSANKRHGHSSRSSRRSRSSSVERRGSRKRRSESRSLDRKSSRRSRSRSHSRRHKSYRHRSRSSSRGRRRDSRSYSRERRSFSGERSNSQRSSVDKRKVTVSSSLRGHLVSENMPGFVEMTLLEQAEERMRQAFKAAAAIGEKAKGLTALDSGGFSFLDTKNFAASVAAIDSDDFVASSFKSSRATKLKEEPADGSLSHDDAIFGSLAISGFTLTPDPDSKPVQFDQDSIIHPSLYCNPQEKMDKWIARLTQLRRRRLEGEALLA